MPEIPIGGSFYKMDSQPISSQECVNFYASIPEKKTTSRKNLLIPSGIKLAASIGNGELCRGGHVFQGIPYFVQGTDLYRIDRSLDSLGAPVYTPVKVNGSTSIPGSARVILADNGEEGGQMMIAVPELDTKFNAYVYTVGGGLAAVSDSDFDGPVLDVNYVDGYFEFTKKDSQKIFVSNLRDGTAYTSTDFTKAEADPDSNVRSFVLRNVPYVFGVETFQPYQNIGGAGFPFATIPGAAVRKGLASRYAIVEVNDNMVFLGRAEGETPAIWISSGGKPERLSTIPIDEILATYSSETIASCFAWKYGQGGGQFVGFYFPKGRCFVFDFRSGEWHTRTSLSSRSESVPYRVAAIVDAYGALLVGDLLSDKIGVLDKATYTEYGEKIPRYFVLPPLDNEGQPFIAESLEAVMNTGLGLSTGQGSDPQILMSFSKDGGRTFSNTISRSAGSSGDYRTRVIWNDLGRIPRDIVFRFDVNDPVPWAITKIEAELE